MCDLIDGSGCAADMRVLATLVFFVWPLLTSGQLSGSYVLGQRGGPSLTERAGLRSKIYRQYTDNLKKHRSQLFHQ